MGQRFVGDQVFGFNLFWWFGKGPSVDKGESSIVVVSPRLAAFLEQSLVDVLGSRRSGSGLGFIFADLIVVLGDALGMAQLGVAMTRDWRGMVGCYGATGLVTTVLQVWLLRA